ncbi:FliH/SctL family protein [Stakelama tenebrarum]|uniref:Flagellar assembly protein FliH n=1 Tax=Stakelama tenebrarum TaxID=2711215 RepID=A0A6G6Y1C0_9SPHN|nr:FliH/SctL family protein [Sphingosinithalassobacter tenebrarum]QIG78722.1 flagellar biosynthesis protein FliH [Sphingosinithalassobacter tenebrarum]
MSDFVPGFASRQVAAEDALERAFGDTGGSHDFSPGEAMRVVGRPEPVQAEPDAQAAADAEAPVQPRHFSPANPGTNPTEGWDPFAGEVTPPAPEPTGFSDPIAAAREKGFAEGRAAAQAEAAAARGQELALLEQVSQSLSAGTHFDRDRLAAQIRQTVIHLVTRMVGELGISPELLAGRIEAAVEMLADSAESALLRVHPDDVELLTDRLPANVFPVGDPNLTRGSFVIESASTIVEDGPDLWIEQLAEAIDRVPIPPTC